MMPCSKHTQMSRLPKHPTFCVKQGQAVSSAADLSIFKTQAHAFKFISGLTIMLRREVELCCCNDRDVVVSHNCHDWGGHVWWGAEQCHAGHQEAAHHQLRAHKTGSSQQQDYDWAAPTINPDNCCNLAILLQILWWPLNKTLYDV